MNLEEVTRKRKKRKTRRTFIIGLILFIGVTGGLSSIKSIREYKLKKSLAPNAIYEEMFKEFKDIDEDGYKESVIKFGDGDFYEVRWDKDGRPEIIYPIEE